MMKLMSDAYIVAQGATIWQYLGMKEKQALSPRSTRPYLKRSVSVAYKWAISVI